MDSPDLTSILSDLADGRIDAAEASRRIDALKGGPAGPPEDRPQERPSDPPREAPTGQTPRGGAERVAIRAVGRRVRVVGDPSVATVAIEGPHVLRRQGSTLEVTSDGDLGPTLEGFSLLRPPRSLDDLRSVSLVRELVVRVNPTLVVDAEVTAGSLAVDNVATLGRIRVTAGGATLRGVGRVEDALIQAGTATVEGVLRSGRSRVRCESGSLTVTLLAGSSVTIRGDAQVGRIAWPGEDSTHVDEVVVGDGTARLDVGIVMGHATIRTQEEDR